MNQDSLLKLRAIYPNPFSDHAAVFYTLTEDARVAMSLYNVAGEPVYRLEQDGLRGSNEMIWKGENGSGGRVASGVYLLHLEAHAPSGNWGEEWAEAMVAR
jgi:hypothetical protein